MVTLSTIYCTMMLSSMFLPPVLIKKFGCKWTMAGSMCCYMTFSLANFYPNWCVCFALSCRLLSSATELEYVPLSTVTV